MLDVHVICLESAYLTRGKVTMAYLEKELDKSLYSNLVKVTAVTPKDFVLEEVVDTKQFAIITKKLPRIVHADLDKAEQVGCALSHIGIWQTCAQSKQPVVVVEDDVRPSNISKRIRDALVFKDADLVLLACNSFAHKFTNKVSKFTGTGAYYLTPRGATTLLKGALPVSMHIDHYMTTCIDAYDLDVYSIEHANDQAKTKLGSTLGHGANMMAIVVPRLEITIGLLAFTLALVILLGTRGLLLLKKRLNTQATNYQTSSTSTNKKPKSKVAKIVKS